MQLVSADIRSKSFTYQEFFDYVNQLFEKGMVTGGEQGRDRLDATKLNLSRVNRLNKTAKLDLDLIKLINSIDFNWEWVLILEGWCGDGAQIAPYINKIAEQNDKINLRIVLRDENPELMDNYLTNGTRSIPVLICVDGVTGNEVGYWGPRPKALLDWIERFKNENPDYTSSAFKKALHTFYSKDKGAAICSDLIEVISEWKESCEKSD